MEWVFGGRGGGWLGGIPKGGGRGGGCVYFRSSSNLHDRLFFFQFSCRLLFSGHFHVISLTGFLSLGYMGNKAYLIQLFWEGTLFVPFMEALALKWIQFELSKKA